MIRTDLMPKSLPDKIHQRRLRAVAISCGLHALGLGLAIGATLFYESKIHPTGSPSGGQLTELPALVIVSAPPAPQPKPTPPPAPSSAPVASTTLTQTAPETKSKPIDAGVPVLPVKLVPKPEPTIARSDTATSPKHVVETKPAKTETMATSTSSTAPSSYAPGPNDFPHPPYPNEARDRRESGTVVMNVQFDASGDVARADVAQSSGVRILDTCTRTFIRDHWHEPAFAGQTVSIPVAYKLDHFK